MTERFSNVQYEGQTFTFGPGRTVLGPDLVLSQCTLIVPKTSNLILTGVIATNTEIRAERLQRLHTVHSAFEHCRFLGIFEAVQFATQGATVSRCDFRKAELRDCEFLGGKVQEQQFSGWPQFVISEPGLNRRAILEAPWPRSSDKLTVAVQVIAQMHPQKIALAASARDWSRRFKVGLEDLRKAVETLRAMLANDLDEPCVWVEPDGEQAAKSPTRVRRQRR